LSSTLPVYCSLFAIKFFLFTDQKKKNIHLISLDLYLSLSLSNISCNTPILQVDLEFSQSIGKKCQIILLGNLLFLISMQIFFCIRVYYLIMHTCCGVYHQEIITLECVLPLSASLNKSIPHPLEISR
jgi:hypothetical protein